MDASGPSLDLLSHFDVSEADEVPPPLLMPTVGVFCVLKWAAAVCVLFVTACVLLQLGYCIAAEQALSRAARAGLVEATLPRATRQSIIEIIERRLADKAIPPGAAQITIRQNDAPLQRAFRLNDDDRLSVALSLPTQAVLPAWLNAIQIRHDAARVEMRAERHIPSRRLPAPHQPAAE